MPKTQFLPQINDQIRKTISPYFIKHTCKINNKRYNNSKECLLTSLSHIAPCKQSKDSYTLYVMQSTRNPLKWNHIEPIKHPISIITYQEIVMPFLVPIVYPTSRDEREIEKTIHIWHILRP